MKRSDFRFFHRLRVRWAEVDMQKIVFNAHYLMYFDTAITEYWRALALPMEEVFARLGGELYVKKATVEFNASAQMDDLIDVALRCERIGNSSIQFIGAIFHGDKHLISSEIIYVFADPISQTSRPVPEALRNAFMALEAGEPMVEMKVGTWAELGQDAGQVRNEVFVEEQKIPKELEWDAADADAVHAVAYNRLGMPLATGRYLPYPAAGRAGVPFDPAAASASIAGIEVYRAGVPTDINAAEVSDAMKMPDVLIEVNLGDPAGGAFTIYTRDFSYDYVRINAEYTT